MRPLKTACVNTAMSKNYSHNHSGSFPQLRSQLCTWILAKTLYPRNFFWRLTCMVLCLGCFSCCLNLTFTATMFLEFWKRKQATIQYDWDVAGYELEERLRPDYEAKVTSRRKNPITQVNSRIQPWKLNIILFAGALCPERFERKLCWDSWRGTIFRWWSPLCPCTAKYHGEWHPSLWCCLW